MYCYLNSHESLKGSLEADLVAAVLDVHPERALRVFVDDGAHVREHQVLLPLPCQVKQEDLRRLPYCRHNTHLAKYYGLSTTNLIETFNQNQNCMKF